MDSAFSHVEDYGETIGFVESLLNYMLKRNLVDDPKKGCLPIMLFQIRVIQFVIINPGCVLFDISEFLQKIGYVIKIQELEFVIYCLIRAELILWDSASSKRTIEEVPFFISIKGGITLNKIFYSVTYFSESLLVAELPIRGLGMHLRSRQSSRAIWVADCAYNSILGLELIKEIENYENSFSTKNSINMEKYFIVEKLQKKLYFEITKIINSNSHETQTRWEENLNYFLSIGELKLNIDKMLGDLI